MKTLLVLVLVGLMGMGCSGSESPTETAETEGLPMGWQEDEGTDVGCNLLMGENDILKQSVDGQTFCEARRSHCSLGVPPPHRPEGGTCLEFATYCDIPTGWIDCNF